MFCLQSVGAQYVTVSCDTADALIVVTPSELVNLSSPFAMDLESGAAIGGAVLGAMALAFVFRMAIKLLNESSEP